jgi:hypothetical protein
LGAVLRGFGQLGEACVELLDLGEIGQRAPIEFTQAGFERLIETIARLESGELFLDLDLGRQGAGRGRRR